MKPKKSQGLLLAERALEEVRKARLAAGHSPEEVDADEARMQARLKEPGALQNLPDLLMALVHAT